MGVLINPWEEALIPFLYTLSLDVTGNILRTRAKSYSSHCHLLPSCEALVSNFTSLSLAFLIYKIELIIIAISKGSCESQWGRECLQHSQYTGGTQWQTAMTGVAMMTMTCMKMLPLYLLALTSCVQLRSHHYGLVLPLGCLGDGPITPSS